jgi:hypothetical protein
MKPGDGRAIVAVDFARAIRASGILSAEDRAVLSREAPVTIAGVDRASTTSLDWPRHKLRSRLIAGAQELQSWRA